MENTFFHMLLLEIRKLIYGDTNGTIIYFMVLSFQRTRKYLKQRKTKWISFIKNNFSLHEQTEEKNFHTI